MSAPCTVAFVNHVALVSGAEQSLLIALANLDRARYHPVLICPEGPLAQRARALGVEVRHWAGVRPRRRLSSLVRLALAALTLRPLLVGADLVHANSLAAALAAAPWRGRRRLVWHVRDLRLPVWPVRLLARRADAVIAISTVVADHLRRLGVPECRLRIVPNALDAATFRPRRPRAEVRAELGLSELDSVVLTVGQLVPWKGHDVLLDAWAEVIRERSAARLLIVGADLFDEHRDHVSALRRRSEQPDLAGHVTWLGARDDVADLMAASDVLALPSRGEPFGRVLLEAAAVGLPVVATAPGGPTDIVVPGETGRLVPVGDAAALAEALGELLALPAAQRAAMGRAARERLDRLFTPRSQAEQLVAVYGTVRSGGSA